MDRPNRIDSYNAGYVQALFEQYLRNPSSVDDEWRRLFASADPAALGLAPLPPLGGAAPVGDGVAPELAAQAPAPTASQLRVAMAAAELLDAYRLHGHRAARLDPLDSEPTGHPMLDPRFHGIEEEELAQLPASVLGFGIDEGTLADVFDEIKALYTGSIGYEYEHLENPAHREWLREQIETGEHRRPLEPEDRKRLLERLSEVEGFEQFLHRAYLGAKRFSVEGTEMLIPMLDLAIDRAAEAGAQEAIFGMAHRGRLNVLAHVLGRSYESIISQFEGQHGAFGTTGDVKYHLGAEGTYATSAGEVTVQLAPNPSHLEFVDPVVQGIARAKQTHRTGEDLARDPNLVVPVLIHGDAAFAGQGIVAETLNMADLEGFSVGGTLHVIVNNQIGFTTSPEEGRSTHYASDMARGFEVPIFHVNADDPEACLAVVRLALAYRAKFHGDVVIDLIGYRRYGHNEGDEPAYTQPRMYAKVTDHPPVRRIWSDGLVRDGVATEEEVEAAWEAVHQRLTAAQDEVRRKVEADGRPVEPPPAEPATLEPHIDTAISPELLRSLHRQLHSWPDDFRVNPKLLRQLQRRAKTLDEDGPIDWAHAEALAFASLVAEGTPIRVTGQDVARGTFSQRHLVLHDIEDGRAWAPIQHLEEAQATFVIYNSPLSEASVVGFEYGYSTAVPKALVLWEAQFGDFGNAAQVTIDQFIAAGRAKWGQLSRMVLLLPHGYEGQGPEHSSARLERFLQLAAEDNIRVADCTTPAQYFHLLRRQALLDELRPLVVFTPKSLLRNPRATSRAEELTGGRFRLVIDDEEARARADEIRRVVLCTGKVYYDLVTGEGREAAGHVAVLRVEQLYPFPEDELAEILAGYGNAEELVWVQEEPRNMGAWFHMERELERLAGDRLRMRYIGRPERASPAEGYANAHEEQQKRLVQSAFAAPAGERRRAPRARSA